MNCEHNAVGPQIQETLIPALPAGQTDFGLWLLRTATARGPRWLRLDEEWRAIPRRGQRGARSGYETFKRLLDLFVSIVLIVLLLPLLLLIALLVRLDSPGPALFRQRRVGKNGEEFLLWKFRSMRIGAPSYAPSPTSNLDPRLTRIGRLLRRTSFDEIAQLINVLSGEMSLVGPRPEMPFIVAGYGSFERQRLLVKPGITGLWQVSPARAFPIHENLQFDLHYIRHRNLMLDSAILVRTIVAVIQGIGAV